MGEPDKCNAKFRDWPLSCNREKGHDGQHEGKLKPSDAGLVGDSPETTYRWR